MSSKLHKSQILIIKELKENPAGLTAKNLLILTNLGKRNLYKHLNKLKKAQLIEHIYPIWKPLATLKKVQSAFPFQLHKITWKLTLIKKPEWWNKRQNKLIKLKDWHYKDMQLINNPYQQLSNKGFIIHIFANSIMFFSQKTYTDKDAWGCFLQAMQDFIYCIEFLENNLNFKFLKDQAQQVSISTQHHNHLQNTLANRLRKSRKGFEYWIKGKLRFWIDFSEPYGTEFGHKDYAPEDAYKIGKIYEQYIEENAKSPKEIEESMQELQANYMRDISLLSKQIQAHLLVINEIKELSTENKKLFKAIRENLQSPKTFKKISLDTLQKKIRENQDLEKI